jgi:hypothetical protein
MENVRPLLGVISPVPAATMRPAGADDPHIPYLTFDQSLEALQNMQSNRL